jgi:hypothetical protein
MSKERELLESCLDEMQYHSVDCPELVFKIKELLAEPEKEPLTDDYMYNKLKEDYEYLLNYQPKREPIDAFKAVQEFEGYYIYKNGFIDGIKYAEKEHGIGEL